MIDALIGVGVVAVLLVAIVGFIAWDRKHPEERTTGGFGALDEVFQPGSAEAHDVWEAEQRLPAAPPLPGDPPAEGDGDILRGRP